MATARDELLHGLFLLGGREVIVSSNVPLRRDGYPAASYSEPRDPGVAVYWTTRKGEPRVMACDHWRLVHHNVRAIGLAIEALRALERSGASQILDRAFAGFAALPAQAGPDGTPPWRDILGLPDAAVTRAQIETAYRERLRTEHPDVGGTHESMVALNRARAQAYAEVRA